MGSNDNDENTNFNVDNLIELTLAAAHIAIADSFPGQIYEKHIVSTNASTNTSKSIFSEKFQLSETNETNQMIYCGITDNNESNSILIPTAFINSVHDSSFDCSFIKTGRDNFDIDQPFQSISDIVAINLYPNYNGDLQPIEHVTDQCDPYLIEISVKNDTLLTNLNDKLNNDDLNLDQSIPFPACNFWNNSKEKMDGMKRVFCTKVNIQNKSVICGCIHLSTFKVSQKDFVPKANVIGIWHFRSLTLDNLWIYPTVWITLLSLFFIIFCCCVCSWNENENRSMLAYEDIIFEHVRREKLKTQQVGRQIDYISRYLPHQDRIGQGLNAISHGYKAKRSLCLLHLSLFKIGCKIHIH